MLYTLAWYVVAIGPYVLLAFAGTFLWSRECPLPSIVVAVGFLAAALSQIAAAVVSARLSAAVDSSEGIAFVMHRYQSWQWFTRDLGAVGVWAAVAGFLAHSSHPWPRGARSK